MHKITIQELYSTYLSVGQKFCTDTRKLEKGAIFFALKGDHFNANEFAQKAIESGCAFAVIDEEKYYINHQTLLVDNVLETLQNLANYHRRQLKIPFLGITGSNGKTTTKELIATVLSKKYTTLATFGNLNNHIGVPLTILSIKPEHEFAIIEMGANHQGEIEQLCNIAEPDFGLITNIGKAHLEGFGGIEGVKKGKSELYKFIKGKSGKLFVNADDEVLIDLASTIDKVTYGFKHDSDIIGKDCTNKETVSFSFKKKEQLETWDELHIVNTNIIGHYNLINCLAACCIGSFFGVEENKIIEALEHYFPNMNRSQLVKTEHNSIILDAYNANPNSMKVAIENFAGMQAANKLVLLGDMFELGEYSRQEHQNIVDLLISKQLRNVILVGPQFQNCVNHPFISVNTTKECAEYLNSHKTTQHTILIKGSRGMKMETLVEQL